MKGTVYKITLTAILTSLALIAFIIEGSFPPLFIPGVRLGISNVFILLCFILAGKKYAFTAAVLKSVAGSLFAGNISAILYSLPSGLIALTVEITLISLFPKVTPLSASCIGGALNTLTQAVIFTLITRSYSFAVYLPYCFIAGAVTGAAVGFAVITVIKLLPLKFLSGAGDCDNINTQGEKPENN